MALSIDQAKALVIEFCATYPVAASISFKIRETQEELYGPHATREAEGTILGSFHPGRRRALFATAGFRDEAHFRRVVRHEILGHFGINTFYPKEKRALLEAIIEARNQPGLRETWAVVDRAYPSISELRKAEEVYAFSCEDIDPHIRTSVSSGIKALQQVCIERRRPLTFEDLINLTTMVAEGLHDRTRSQKNFPVSDSAQFSKTVNQNFSTALSMLTELTMVDNNATEVKIDNEPQLDLLSERHTLNEYGVDTTVTDPIAENSFLVENHIKTLESWGGVEIELVMAEPITATERADFQAAQIVSGSDSTAAGKALVENLMQYELYRSAFKEAVSRFYEDVPDNLKQTVDSGYEVAKELIRSAEAQYGVALTENGATRTAAELNALHEKYGPRIEIVALPELQVKNEPLAFEVHDKQFGFLGVFQGDVDDVYQLGLIKIEQKEKEFFEKSQGAAPSTDQGPQPLNFNHNGQPASLNLQDYQPGQLPETTIIRPIERKAPPLPNFTHNGQPASFTAETAPDWSEDSAVAPVTPEMQLPAEPAAVEPKPELASTDAGISADTVAALPEPTEPTVSVVLKDQADVAISDASEKTSSQAIPVVAPTEMLQAPSAEFVSQAQTAETPSNVKGLTPDELQWAKSQPWFNGEGQDDDGAYVFARELNGKQVQWMFRNTDELKTWAEQQRPPKPQAMSLPEGRPSVAVDSTHPELSADAIHVGARIGKDESPLQPSLIDKDALLTRITHEPQPDNSVLYKLDNQPAFVDRGSRLEMVPGAGQSDEKIVAALLTAARFYRGQIELTGSDAFKAKAIELIAQHHVNVTMKNPAQQLMLDQARQSVLVPSAQPDTIVGDTPPPYNPAPPVASANQPSVASSLAPQQPAAALPSAQEVLAQSKTSAAGSHVIQEPYAPLQPNGHGSPIPAKVQAGPVDNAPAKAIAEKIDPSVHQPAEEAAHGIKGKVLACGKAPFRFDPENTESVYIKLRTKTGVQTFWGKELAGVLRDTRIQPGRIATLQWLGKKQVTIKAPVKDPDSGKVVRYEEKNTHRNQWELTPENGATVRTGDDQGVKLVAYDANRFAMIQNSVLAQVNVPLDPPVLPNDGLFWMTPNGQGSAKTGDELSAARPAVDSTDAGKALISSWSADGQLDMALFRGDGPYLQGVVRHGDGYQHVLVSLPGDANAPPMVFNAITEQGLVPIGAGNAINRSGDQPVAREHIAFKLEGDSSARIGKLDFPAEVPPALHHRLGFDERWKDTNTLPKSVPAAAPKAQPSAVRPS